MSPELDVALATCRELPELDPDEEVLTRALEQSGMRSRLLAWDDPDADFSSARLTVLRSTWNYPSHSQEFASWLEKTASVSDLWNPLPVVRWNLHKRYLFDLQSEGVPVVSTVLLRTGDSVSLEALQKEREWPVVVVKPAISANSMDTIRVGESSLQQGEEHLQRLLRTRDVLVQPYLSSVEGYGERALIWIDGELSHAVRKSARFTGTDEAVTKQAVRISDDEARLAERVVDLVRSRFNERLLYARLDLARSPDGRPVVMEVELIEPSLYFRQSTEALTRFVAAIQRRLEELSAASG